MDPAQRNLERHPGGADRARRLPLQLVIRYRLVGETGWRRARTKNVSRSGVLFLTDEVVDVAAPLEMMLRFELDEHSPRSGEAHLLGWVVRLEDLARGSGMHAIAAAIHEHSLHPAGLGDTD